jgi:hypothetical protein
MSFFMSGLLAALYERAVKHGRERGVAERAESRGEWRMEKTFHSKGLKGSMGSKTRRGNTQGRAATLPDPDPPLHT